MNKIVIVAVFSCLMVCISAAAIESQCGVNEFYTPPGKCAPCEINCSEYVIPCKSTECRTGCQCYLGYERDEYGVCQDTYACGKTPEGSVD